MILPKYEAPIVKVDVSKSTNGSSEYELLSDPTKRDSFTHYDSGNGKSFTTNEYGFVDELTFTPETVKASRDSRQTAAGKEGLEIDVGGHIQACSMGGTCDQFNLFPQDKNFNNSGYKKFENEIRGALKNGDVGTVTVKFQRSNPNSARPDALRIEYTINGETKTRRFINQYGG